MNIYESFLLLVSNNLVTWSYIFPKSHEIATIPTTPRIIVIIIGETGLLSRPNIFVPMKTDMLSDKREVSMHIIMPINVFFIIYT